MAGVPTEGLPPTLAHGAARAAGPINAATICPWVVAVKARHSSLPKPPIQTTQRLHGLPLPISSFQQAFSPLICAVTPARLFPVSRWPPPSGWAAALPPLPTADLFRRHEGLFTLHAGIGLAAGQVLLEVGKAQLDAPFGLAIEFSAISKAAATEGVPSRFNLLLFSPERLYAFRLARDTAPPTLELYRPPLSERSVDPSSVPGRQALAGIAASTVASFAARPVGDGRLLIDVGPWVAASFHLSDYASFTTRFVDGAAHPQSVTFGVTMTGADGVGGSAKVTAVGLPRRRMAPRPLDDRIGYFSVNYSWVDDYTGAKPAASGAYIYKWDLAKHPVLKYYVDPSVPRAFWPAVVEGITRWNPAFAAAGHRRPVLQAVVPTDSDWPADYAVDDARFSTISFVQGNEPSAVAAPSVDARTGEILNADIIFNVDMPRTYATMYRLWFAGDSDGRAASRAGMTEAAAPSVVATRSAAASAKPVAGSEEDYVYQQISVTTTHEVGHSLGLRHNFRGSTGIPWSQLTNDTYVAMHGLSTSVMDYLPVGPLPRAKDGTLQRYFVSPVLGAYDVAAIRYGYTDWRSEDEARAFAASVAASGLVLGVDEDQETDALAQQYDMSATPLDWHRHLVRTVQRRLRQLPRTAGWRASPSAADRHADMESLLKGAMTSLTLAAKLVGATAIHRHRTGGTPAVTPLDAATETDAVRWVLSQLRPDDGLLSAATIAAVEPHLLAKPEPACGGVASCLGRSPAALASTLHALREKVLATLLAPSRLERLAANAAATAEAGGDARRRVSVAGLLGAVSETIFGARWADIVPPAKVTGGSLFRAEAQARWVKTLTALAVAEAQPAAAATAASGELSRVAAAVAAAVKEAPDSTHLRGLRLATAAYALNVKD